MRKKKIIRWIEKWNFKLYYLELDNGQWAMRN